MISPVAAWISTNLSAVAVILVFVNFAIALLIYYPFFKIAEKQQVEKEQKEIQKEKIK